MCLYCDGRVYRYQLLRCGEEQPVQMIGWSVHAKAEQWNRIEIGTYGICVFLVIEDDNKIASSVTKGLREAGFAVDQVDNGADGLVGC